MKKKQRICFVAPFAYGLFYPASRQAFGGAEVQLFQLSTALAKQGEFEVFCILANFGQQEEVKEGVRLLRSFAVLPKGNTERFMTILTGPFAFFRALHRAKADVYVQRTASFETGLTALYCLLTRKRFIYMVAHERDCTGEYAANHGWRGWLYRFGLHHANTVIAQHVDQQILLRAHEGIESVVFPTVYPVHTTSPSFEERSGALWVGRLLPWKQPEIFLQIAESLPCESFTMIGDGMGAFAESIKQHAKALPNVQYISHVPFADITDYFANTRCFVNTSKAEGYPNTLIQSLQCGTPICTLSVNPEGILQDRGVGLWANGDRQRLLAYVQQCLQDEARFVEMRLCAKSLFQEKHAIDTRLTRFISFLT